MQEELDNSDKNLTPAIENRDMENISTIALTENEALFLSDNMSLIVDVSSDETDESIEYSGPVFTTMMQLRSKDGIPAPQGLLEKIMICLLEFSETTHDALNVVPANKSKEVNVTLERIDLWVLREIVQSTAMRSNEMVGHNLTLKIARALLGDCYTTRKISDRLLDEVFPAGTQNSV